VTIAFAIAKRFQLIEVFPYVLSQLSGAFLASIILKYLFPANATLGEHYPPDPYCNHYFRIHPDIFLMLHHINVATGSKRRMFAGLAIGSTVLLESYVCGSGHLAQA